MSSSLPNSETAWYRSYDDNFKFLEGAKITLEDLQTLREHKVSGSTLNDVEALLLRTIHYQRKECQALAPALLKIGKIDPKSWETVENIVFNREPPASTTAKDDAQISNIAFHPKSRESQSSARPKSPEENSSETPASPDEPGQQNWVSMELPMSIWFNLRTTIEHIMKTLELPPFVDNTLDSKVGAYRTALTNMSTVSHLFKNIGTHNNTTFKSRPQQSHHDNSPGDDEIKVIPEQGVMEEGNQRQTQHHDSVDETLNLSFIGDFINVGINRTRDYLDKAKGQMLDLPLVANPAFIAERRRFKVADIITADTDGYMTIPEPRNSSAFVLIVEAKRSVKNNSRLPFQIAAQLTGWMQCREEEFTAVFARGGVAEQHLLLLQFTGDEATFFTASFGPLYLKYVASAKGCTRNRLIKGLKRQIQDQWQRELTNRKNEGNMPTELLKEKLKEQDKQIAGQAKGNLKEKLAKLKQPLKEDSIHYKMMYGREVIKALQATVQADTKEPTQALPTDPRQGAIPTGTGHFMHLQGYGAFSLSDCAEMEMLLKACIGLDIAARKG
ncbi:hypothetical protein F4860DRAFT_524019 [Xylaria cubensis]|nr:hypothetical protein F4860DRAFT_524019 [Xylaria cubensis]